jgi:acyl-CoA hydrolase
MFAALHHEGMKSEQRRETQAVRAGSEVHLDEWVAPELADDHGYLRAGTILEWMDVVGVLAAARHCRQPVVTASIDGMELRDAIRSGERVAMTARVAYTSAHSVGVSVTMDHDDGRGVARPTLEAYMTFVPLDRRGRSVEVPQFSPETPLERARFREGQLRREFRRRLHEEPIKPPADDVQLLDADVAEHDRPLFLQQWMARLPRYLRMPWERHEAQAPRRRHRSYMHKIEPVRLSSLNFHGTLYGGILMRWSETSANLSARAYADGAAVRCTGLHGLTFLRPVERDRFVHLRSVVVHTAGSTLTSLVSVQSEDPTRGEYVENLRAFFTFAPHDAAATVAPLVCQSEEERALFDEVERRFALQRRLVATEERAA